MRESTIEQKEDIFIIRLFDNVYIKSVQASSISEAQFISRCWDSGIFSKDEFDYG